MKKWDIFFFFGGVHFVGVKIYSLNFWKKEYGCKIALFWFFFLTHEWECATDHPFMLFCLLFILYIIYIYNIYVLLWTWNLLMKFGP